MRENKKFYWLKLKKDFFKRHDIKIIEAMPNGKDYILFYLKLLCESIGHEGNLRFSQEIPYNEEMLAIITNTNVDVVRSAVKIFSQLDMMELMDDGTYYMREVNKMIGFETEWAEKKREYRAKKNEQKTLGKDNVLPLSDKSKSIEIDKDILNILSVWNEKKIIIHKESKELFTVIEKAIKTYGVEEIKKCIDRYHTILTDENYFFNYKWTLKEFLKQKNAISSFSDEGSKWNDYTNRPKVANNKKVVKEVPNWYNDYVEESLDNKKQEEKQYSQQELEELFKFKK